MKKTLKIWSLLIAFSMAFSLCTVFSGLVSFGANVIEIDSAEKLRKIGIDEAYPLDADYKLTADIDLSDADWYGIGYQPATGKISYFTGNFDGQGHVISGMHYGTSETAKEVAELWAFIPMLGSTSGTSTVKNLIFKDVFYNGYDPGNYTEVGTVVGYSKYDAVMEDVAVLSGSLTDNGSRQVRVGGLMGCWNGTASMTIRNCYNGANVEVNCSLESGSNWYVAAAGIVGAANNKNLTITNCVNTGIIKTDTAYRPTKGTTVGSYSGISAIASRGANSSTSFATGTTVSNCYSIEGCVISADPEAISIRDNSGTTVLTLADAADKSKYTNLTEGWTLQDGYYPFPAALDAKYAAPAIPADAIAIRTADDLRKIGVDAAYPMDGHYVLMADIDLADGDWTPIGSADTVFFTGTFDGNGHVISNLHIGTPTEPKVITGNVVYGYGLFSYLGAGAKVCDLLFKDICINVNASGRTNLAVGAVAGYTNASGWTIDGVVVLSGLISGSNQRQNRVGGILGCCTSATNGATVSNCFNGAEIVSTFSNTSGNCYAGAAGMIGFTNGKNLTVVNCLNVGKIVTLKSGNGNNRGSVGNIVAFPSTNTTIKTELLDGSVVTNCFAQENLLDYDTDSSYTAHLEADRTSVTVVTVENAMSAASFSALTAVDDGDVWVCADGEYPMLKLFRAYARPVVDDSGAPVEPEKKAIEISSEAQLRQIGNSAEYPLSGDYVLTADIDLSASSDWEPIGGLGEFTGTFDGNGHVITGLHIGTKTTAKTIADTEMYSYGLFSQLGADVKISNLLFKDICINVSATGRSNVAVGAVAGYSNKAGVIIENVAVVSGFLKGSCTRQTRVSGILGVTRHENGSLIRNCYNGAEIQGTYTSTATNSYLSLAGIVGFYESPSENPGIVNCLNVGKIVALKTSGTTNYSSIGAIAALANTGGVAFDDRANLSNCYTIKALLDYDLLQSDRISQFASDANSAKVKAIAPVASGTAQAYAGLVNGSDGAWTAKDGFYPMLTLFKDYAVAVDVEGDIESYLKEILKEQYISNALTQDGIQEVVKDALGDSFTVNTCTLELVKATAAKNGTYKISVAFTDGAKDYSVVLEGTFALPTIEYTFRTEQKGLAEGTVKVTDPAYRADLSYALYWGTEEGLLEGYTHIAAQTDLKVSGTTLTFEFPDRVAIPQKATHLWVAVNGTPVCSYAVPSSRALVLKNLIYNYGMLSDIHFYDSGAPVAFAPAMELFASAQAKFMASTGDFSNGGTAGNWKSFTDAYAAGGWTFPVFTATGNHDILKWNLAETVTPEQAMSYLQGALETYANENYTQDKNGNKYKITVSEKYPDYDYTVEFGDDLFVYMGIGAFRNDSPKNVDQHLALDQLKWLDGVLADYYENSDVYGHVYLVFHYYTMESGFGMYQNGSTSGTEWSRNMNGFMTSGYNSSEELFKILSKYPNVIHFSGHTHRNFSKNNNLSVTRNYIRVNDNGNYKASDEELGYVAVHVPGLRASQEGYLVSVYENGILLTGYNFGTGEIVPSATFFLANEEIGTQIRVNETTGYLEYVQNYGEWNNLIAQKDLKDANGNSFQLQITDTHVQWKYTKETEWKNLIALSDLTDANGNAAELKTEGNYVKVRYGTGAWSDLVELKGVASENPDTSAGSSSLFAILAVLAVISGGAVIYRKKRNA